jgi:hypothetical protein
MRPESIVNQKILLSPLNWGMGHVARCIPIVHQLLQQNNQVIVACTEEHKEMFKCYFPFLCYLPHAGYPFRFNGKGKFALDLLAQYFPLKNRLALEQNEVEQMVEKQAIDLVISDHRYGFFSKKCPSIFLTHQLNLPLPWFLKGIDQFHKKLFTSFDHIWVLDTKTSQFAGKLSVNKKNKKVEYIGPYSRFSLYSPCKKTIPTVVLISGPEPYAQHFFTEQFQLALEKKEHSVFIVPKKYGLKNVDSLIEIVESTDWKMCDEVLLKAKKIIARSGYSTIMDLSILNTECELHTTPNQKEQEYLFQLHGDPKK